VTKIHVQEESEAATDGEVIRGVLEIDQYPKRGMGATGSPDDEKCMSEVTMMETIEPHSHPLLIGDFPFDEEDLKLPTCLGFSVEGDEALEGALFNYARLFTFREFCSKVTKAFDASIQTLKAGDRQKKGIAEVAAACKLDRVLLQAYTPWREIDIRAWHDMLIAAGAAIFVQWGTVRLTPCLRDVELMACRLGLRS
jgi:hypothetical protein